MPDSDIGGFEIGPSPVGGTALSFDYLRTVISQYQNSPRLLQLINNMDAYLDPTANIAAFISLVQDLNTAVGYGLDVWGRILGAPSRVLQIATSKYLGFKEGGTTDYDAFGQAPFWTGTPVTGSFTLSDDAYRLLLFAKAAANIWDGSIKALNQLLLNLFPGRGNSYVAETGVMQITYTFNFELQPYEVTIVNTSGILPKPVGVTAFVSHL